MACKDTCKPHSREFMNIAATLVACRKNLKSTTDQERVLNVQKWFRVSKITLSINYCLIYCTCPQKCVFLFLDLVSRNEIDFVLYHCITWRLLGLSPYAILLLIKSNQTDSYLATVSQHRLWHGGNFL